MDGSHQQMIFSGSSDNGQEAQDKTEFTFALLMNGLSLILQVPRYFTLLYKNQIVIAQRRL